MDHLRHHSTKLIANPHKAAHKMALVLLNLEKKQIIQSKTFQKIFKAATLTLCADGAANRLYDALLPHQRLNFLPNVIRGDLDSIRSDVRTFYKAHGVSLERDASQHTHDFEKCLQYLNDDAGQCSEVDQLSVLSFGAFGGRLDQTMANLNMLYKFRRFGNHILISQHSLAFLLPRGSNLVEPDPKIEDGSCGLIPLGSVVEGVCTSGLKWNLDGGKPLEFGSLVSSSNEFVASSVRIDTPRPVLWTSNFREGVWD